jgi:malate permease and related proteins
MFGSLLLIIVFILIGVVLKRSGKFPENTATVLNSFVLFVALPSIILLSISKVTLNTDALIPIFIHWPMFLLHLLILVGLNRWLKFSRPVFACLLVVTTMGNTAFLGVPLIKEFLGDEALAYAVLFDQLGSGIAFIFVAAVVIPYFSGEERASWQSVLKKLLTFPPFIAVLLGFIFHFINLPALFIRPLESLASTLVPCAMIAVGFQMKFRLENRLLKPFAIGLMLKLLILPLVMLLATRLMGMQSLATSASLLQVGMPPMITAGALAINANFEKELAASLVGYGLVLSFISLSFLNLVI